MKKIEDDVYQDEEEVEVMFNMRTCVGETIYSQNHKEKFKKSIAEELCKKIKTLPINGGIFYDKQDIRYGYIQRAVRV